MLNESGWIHNFTPMSVSEYTILLLYHSASLFSSEGVDHILPEGGWI